MYLLPMPSEVSCIMMTVPHAAPSSLGAERFIPCRSAGRFHRTGTRTRSGYDFFDLQDVPPVSLDHDVLIRQYRVVIA
jgi:hypothetical protein